MRRFLFFLLLLVAGWAIIFFPLTLGKGGEARPGQLPQPWKQGTEVQVSPFPSSMEDGEGAAVQCASQVKVEPGDTLGMIARKCGIPLAGLLDANPQIANPNQVYSGQLLAIPVLEGRGGGDSELFSPGQPGSFTPGSVIQVRVVNMPPSAKVKIGMGLSSIGYRVLASATAGPDGSVSESIVIPDDAVPGEEAFILVSAEGVPSVQSVSPVFFISDD
jgi:LysM repeat protein